MMQQEKPDKKTTQQVTVPSGLTICALLTIVLWGAIAARPFLVPLCISGLIAFTLAPLVKQLLRMRLPEWAAIALSAFLLILPISSLLYLFAMQAQNLLRDFPALLASFDAQIASFSKTAIGQTLHLSKRLNLTRLLEQFASSTGEGISLFITGISAVVNAGFHSMLILLFSILMIASREHLRRCTERILSRSKLISDSQIESKRLLNDVAALIEKFLVARLVIVALVALIDTGILLAFKIPYAFLLGTILGIMTLVPGVGFFLSLAPVIVVSFAKENSFLKTLSLSCALGFVAILEGNVLTPKWVGYQLNINALAAFVGLFAGGLAWGIWGMLLSVPALGVVRILFSAVPSLQPWGDLLADRSLDQTRISMEPTETKGKKPAA